MQPTAIDSIYRAFGEAVRRHRERLHLTQDAVARVVGLSRTSITNIERGRQHVSLHHLIALARALKVPPEVLIPILGDEAEPLWVAERLPPGTDRAIARWAAGVLPKNLETGSK